MKLGSYRFTLSFFLLLFYNLTSFAEDRVSTSPLINLNELKPSFEEVENTPNELLEKSEIKDKKKSSTNNLSSAHFIGLDKITAKTSDINIVLGKKKRFGYLEILPKNCKRSLEANDSGVVAYLQVKDLSDKSDEKVFVFNGWTFSSSPTLRPFDHPVYDLWLTGCENI